MSIVFDQADNKLAKNVVPPHKQRDMPKIRQHSPLKMSSPTKRSGPPKKVSLDNCQIRLSSAAAETGASTKEPPRDDCIDIRIKDIEDQHDKDLQSDPTLNAGRSLRRDRKRNYKEMLEGNEAF